MKGHLKLQFDYYAWNSEAEFKEFEPRLKFETRLKYGWFNLELYSMLQDLSRRSMKTGYWRIRDTARIL